MNRYHPLIPVQSAGEYKKYLSPLDNFISIRGSYVYVFIC